MLPQELHIGFDQEFQSINSNRERSLEPEEKDYFLNKAQIMLMKELIGNRDNVKRRDLQETVKQYDDIDALIRRATVPLYYSDDTEQFGLLPTDYYLFDSATYKVHRNCVVGIGDINIVTDVTKISKVELPTPSGAPFFSNLTITYNNGTTTTVIFDASNFATISGGIPDMRMKYLVVQAILQHVNEDVDDIDVYWERYDDGYDNNTLIFVTSDANAVDITFNYNSTSQTDTFTDLNRQRYDFTGLTSRKKTSRLVKTSRLDELRDNPFGETRWDSALGFKEMRRIYLEHNDEFIIDEVYLKYYRTPRPISLILEQGSELDDDRSEKIISRAVMLAAGMTSKENFQTISELTYFND